MNYFFIIAISFIIVFLITPNIRYFALKFYVIDKVNKRKIHKKLVTKLGGLGIYLGFLGGLFCIVILDPGFFRSNYTSMLGLLIGASLVLILGIYDDFQGSSALLKFIIQIIISSLIIKSGFLLNAIFIPPLINIEFGIFSIPVTLLWLVGIINAVNLIDGLDGLAAGVIGIASFFIFVFGLILRNNFVIYVSLALAGACFAFLRYNFHPAKIFMGDTGSLFLGLIVACLGIYRPVSNLNNPFFIPVVILLFLPIIDTTFAVARRILHKRNIFSGDASHIHHYLVKRGFSQAQAVLRLYSITFLLGVISLFVIFISK
ncbi:MAG: MraY family glycosyltransferase [Candidatus Omnitrophota bacterium]|jgi:UDP-GlcNAc:undecaprenyl-phosphate GlcNAc-1-phosphate transferase